MKYGDIVVNRQTGVRRRIVRVTPAGAFGRSHADGPVFHAQILDAHGDARPGGHVADIWSGSMSYPSSDWEVER